MARLAVHGGYCPVGHFKTDHCCRRLRRPKAEALPALRGLWADGLCRGYGGKYCGPTSPGTDATTIQRALFVFEGNDWCRVAGDPACLKAQREHYTQVHAAGPPPPVEDIVACAINRSSLCDLTLGDAPIGRVPC